MQFKKNQLNFLELKITKIEMKNLLKGLKIRYEWDEERIHELNDWSIETAQSIKQKEKNEEKSTEPQRIMGGHQAQHHTHNENSQSKRKRKKEYLPHLMRSINLYFQQARLKEDKLKDIHTQKHHKLLKNKRNRILKRSKKK